MTDPASKHSRSAFVGAAILVLAVTLLSAGRIANPSTSYPGRDGGIFLYVGSLILDGGTPYVDAWENKGPLVFYLNAAGLLLGSGSRWGVWLLELLFLAGAIALLYFILRLSLGEVPAAGGALAGAWAAGSVLQGGNYSEEYSLLFTLIALWAYLKSLATPRAAAPLIILGCTLGLNVLLRPNLISMQAAIVAANVLLAIRSGDWRLFGRRLALIAVGALAAIVPALLYFAARGALGEMLRVALIFNLEYSQGLRLADIANGLRAVVLEIGTIAAALALSGYALGLYSFWRPSSPDRGHPEFLLPALIGWPLEALLSALSGRNYLHYFIPWAPYIGIFSAVLLSWLVRPFEGRIARYSAGIVAALALLAVGIGRPWAAYGEVISGTLGAGRQPPEFRDPVALYVEAATLPGETVFVWGFRPIVNFVSGRKSPVSFLPYPLVHVDSPLGRDWAYQFYAQFTAAPPTLVVNMIEADDRERIPDLDRRVRREQTIKWSQVVLAPNLADTLKFIETHYSLVGTIAGHDVYRLIAETR